MKKTFRFQGKPFYLRLPETLEEDTVIHLVLPKGSQPKALLIDSIYDEKRIPFAPNTIRDEKRNIKIDYLGRDEYWNPQKAHRKVVSNHPSCEYDECNFNCHVVTCAVYQGTLPCVPESKAYLESGREKKEK